MLVYFNEQYILRVKHTTLLLKSIKIDEIFVPAHLFYLISLICIIKKKSDTSVAVIYYNDSPHSYFTSYSHAPGLARAKIFPGSWETFAQACRHISTMSLTNEIIFTAKWTAALCVEKIITKMIIHNNVMFLKAHIFSLGHLLLKLHPYKQFSNAFLI